MTGLGIRDVILPGEMSGTCSAAFEVTEAKKAAETGPRRSLRDRRPEGLNQGPERQAEAAARRSQSNTARIFEGNPTLMRLKELETLEKIADKAKLSVILGDTGLADKVVKLI